MLDLTISGFTFLMNHTSVLEVLANLHHAHHSVRTALFTCALIYPQVMGMLKQYSDILNNNVLLTMWQLFVEGPFGDRVV